MAKTKKTTIRTRTGVDGDLIADLIRACNDVDLGREDIALGVIRTLFGKRLNGDQQEILIGTLAGDFNIIVEEDGIAAVIFEEEWPDTYRCRNCGSNKVSALAWVGINENNDIGVGDYYSTNIEDPDDKHVQCDSCGHLGGVYGPGEGPDDGIYPSPCDPSDA